MKTQTKTKKINKEMKTKALGNLRRSFGTIIDFAINLPIFHSIHLSQFSLNAIKMFPCIIIPWFG